MPTTKSIFFLATAALLIVVIGCSKNSSYGSNNQGPDANTTLITQAAWIYDTSGIGANTSGAISFALPPGVLKPCEKDDTLYFKSDGTGTENPGPLACDTTAPKIVHFNWSFTANETAITSSDSLFSGFGGTITITSLTQTQLHLLKQVTVSGLPVILDIYLKHP
jgi:hypothetical protein